MASTVGQEINHQHHQKQHHIILKSTTMLKNCQAVIQKSSSSLLSIRNVKNKGKYLKKT
jgi:hypothetical protein